MVVEDAELYVPTKYFGETVDTWGCTNESCNRSNRISQLELKVLDTTDQIMWGQFGDATTLFPMCNACGKTLAIIYTKNKAGDEDITIGDVDGHIGVLM